MGWLWSEKEKEADAKSSTSDSFSAAVTTTTPPPAAAAHDTPSNKEANEFERILQEFQKPASNTTSSSSPLSTSTNPHSSAQQEPSDSSTNNTWTTSTLYPTSMSCTSAFDQAFYCQMFGGQFVSYYRTGALRDCRELWSNFWWCMRTNRGFMSDGERERRIQAFYKAREARLKREGSSEDVWEARREEDLLEYARQQFRWDLKAWEKGEAVLRKD